MCELEEEVEKRSEEISNTESPAFSQDPGREGKDGITLGQREILEASQNETDFIAKVNNAKSGDNKEAGGGNTHDTEDAVPATGGTTFFSESFLRDPLPETTLEANCPAVRMRVLPGAYAMQGMSIGVGEPTRLNSSRSTAVGAGMSAEVGAQNAGDVGLVEARLVNAEEGNMPVGVPANEQCKGGKEIKYPALKVLLLLLFVALVSVGIPALVLSNSDENSQAGTEETTIIEDASILSPEEEYLTRYLPEVTVATIMSSILDVTTNSNNSSELDNMAMKDEELQYHPQLFAFQWLSLDPGLRKYTKARIRQRFALATFYVTTRGDTWADNKHWLSYDHHECDWHVGWNRPKITSPASVTTESACETLDEIAILSESSNSSSELNGFDPNERMFRRLWFRNNTVRN